jgi:lipoprotein-releasing system permease protein
MNIAGFIGERVAFSKQRSFSKFIIRLSIAATVVSVAAMIVTLAFVNGFQKTVSEKIFSFWGHLRIQQFEPNKPLVAEESRIPRNDSVVKMVKSIPEVKQVQAFGTRWAVVEKTKNIEGLLLKGVEQDYALSNIRPFIIEGKWLDFSDSLYARQIILSDKIANLLKAGIGDTVKVYFISTQDQTSTYRPLKIVAIYKTGIEEYDERFALVDLRLIRRLSDWEENEIGGYEVFLSDYKKMDTISSQLSEAGVLPDALISKSVKQIYPNIFDWLNIQDVNRNVIFVVMSVVAIINLITCLLILVLERTRMIGILKAVGSTEWTIQKIFLYHATIITAAGVGLGLILGLGLCYLQKATGFIKLDESAYYVSTAPVEIVWWQVGAVCLGTLVVCFLALIIPTLIIRTIRPVKAIQFR